MALDPNVADPTAWSVLPNLAGDGHLRLEAGAAHRCARYVDNMLDLVVGVHTWIDQNVSLASPTIAASVSGQLLWTVFNVKFGTELQERMDRHRNILTNMGNTFVSAGKQYERTEHESTVSFDDLSFHSPSGTPPPGTPKPVAVPVHPTKPDSTTQYDSYGFGPELGSQLGWETLWVIGNSIDAQAVATAAGVWQWLSETLDTGFTTLRTNISGVSDQWEGAGAEAAIAATTHYVGVSQQLTKDMSLLSDSLLYTSGWLQQTKQYATPPTPSPPPGDSISQQMQNELNLIRLQENFQTYYSVNYTNTLTRIVALPQPDDVATPALDIGDDNVPIGTPTDAHNDDDTGGNHGDPSTGDGGGQHGSDPGEDDPLGNRSPGGDGDDTPIGSSDTETNTPNLSEALKDSPFSSPADLLEELTWQDPGNNPLLVNTALLPPTNNAFGGVGTGGISGRGGLGRALALSPLANQDPKLFPRVTKVPGEKLIGRAGPGLGRDPMMPFGGYPARPGTEEREKKRSELLNSTEHLDDVLGGPGRSVRPVLDR
ncbi:hypothetical protein [Nocardia sputorum]|uniref:hypothetical protein n=1 Tax=Nocardia sputorum TaxID=2984338 RepID=UPI002491506E|nr:hypothetical protein [Nocardia sputorum]